MKKITIFLVLALVSLSSFAQTIREGRFGTEIHFTPWTPGQNFTLVEGVKARFFITDNLAVRTTLNFSTNPQTEYEYTGANLDETKTKSNWTTFGINPGVEYHFASYNRISLYAGAEFRFNMGKAKGVETYSNNNDKVEWIGFNPNTNQRNSTTIGAGVFTGVDFYILSRLYIGAELGLRFTSTSTREFSTKLTTGGTTVENKIKDYDKEAEFRFFCNPAIRLGWNF